MKIGLNLKNLFELRYPVILSLKLVEIIVRFSSTQTTHIFIK